ncbi:hypothetical protein AAC387_Pa07g1572 [Persea americana]
MAIEMAATNKSLSPIPAKKRSNATEMELKRAIESVIMNNQSNGFFVRADLPLSDPSLWYPPGTANVELKETEIMSPATMEMTLDMPS